MELVTIKTLNTHSACNLKLFKLAFSQVSSATELMNNKTIFINNGTTLFIRCVICYSAILVVLEVHTIKVNLYYHSYFIFNTAQYYTITWAAPLIMLGMKSLWPGASSNVTFFVSVVNMCTPTSIVMPLKGQTINTGQYHTH